MIQRPAAGHTLVLLDAVAGNIALAGLVQAFLATAE